jgi:hypothetical protein
MLGAFLSTPADVVKTRIQVSTPSLLYSLEIGGCV